MAALGARDPDHTPRVTEHLPQIITLIGQLVASGHAYVAEGHVLFHTLRHADSGKPSGRDEPALLAGARLEVEPSTKPAGDRKRGVEGQGGQVQGVIWGR